MQNRAITPVSLRTETPAAIHIRAALRDAMAQMRDADVPSHALAAELLLMHILGRDRAWLYAHPEAPLDPQSAQKYFDLVARRSAGTPTQYLTGRQEFWGLEFEVTPAVLIPRPETEHIIEVAIERLGELRAQDPLRIADIGTGSGCIAVALAREFPRAEIVATDISDAALAVARRNAERHGVAGRIRFVDCNLLDALSNEAPGFDLIVSNPPYIARGDEAQLPREVREHEPPDALFSGPAGTEIYAPLIAQSAKLLRTGGFLVLEIGYGALDRVRPLFDESPLWADFRVTNDLAGIPRVISAERA